MNQYEFFRDIAESELADEQDEHDRQVLQQWLEEYEQWVEERREENLQYQMENEDEAV